MIGPNYGAYLAAKQRREQAAGWLAHIGKTGRTSINGKTDRLHLSRHHAAVKLCIAGQYEEGGTNYRDSPEAFNKMLIEVIHDRFADLREEVMRRLVEDEAKALVSAKAEVEAVLSSINEAALSIQTGDDAHA